MNKEIPTPITGKVREEATNGFDAALKARALKDKTINLINASKCMLELKNYILNEEQRINGLADVIRDATKDEKYEEAGTMNILRNQIKNNVYRLSRILQGLPAFEELENNISTG